MTSDTMAAAKAEKSKWESVLDFLIYLGWKYRATVGSETRKVDLAGAEIIAFCSVLEQGCNCIACGGAIPRLSTICRLQVLSMALSVDSSMNPVIG